MDREATDIIYIDIFTEKSEHADLTKGVACLLDAYNTTFHIAHNSHLNHLLRGTVFAYNVEKSRFYRWLRSNLIMLRILSGVKNEKLVFAYFLPIHYLILWIFCKFKQNEVYVFLHGELKYVFHPDGFGQKIGGLCIKYLGFKLSRINFVAISHTVYENLKASSLVKNLSFIEHAIDTLPYKVKPDLKTVGLFGTLSRDKKSEVIYDLACQLEKRGCADDLQLITVGSTTSSFTYDQNSRVKHYCRGVVGVDFHSDSSFFEEVGRLDFCLFFNDTSREYAWTPSAVIYDCLKIGIPILSVNNSTVRSYNVNYGIIGHDFSDLDKLADYLCGDRRKIFIDYLNIQKSMSAVRSHFTDVQFKENLCRVLELSC